MASPEKELQNTYQTLIGVSNSLNETINRGLANSSVEMYKLIAEFKKWDHYAKANHITFTEQDKEKLEATRMLVEKIILSHLKTNKEIPKETEKRTEAPPQPRRPGGSSSAGG